MCGPLLDMIPALVKSIIANVSALVPSQYSQWSLSVNIKILKIIYFQSVSTGLPLNVYNIPQREIEKFHKNTPVVIFNVKTLLPQQCNAINPNRVCV